MASHRDSILGLSKSCILLVGCEVLMLAPTPPPVLFIESFLSFLKRLKFGMSTALPGISLASQVSVTAIISTQFT